MDRAAPATDVMPGAAASREPITPSPSSRFGDWRLAVKSIIGFWLVYALTVLVRALLGGDIATVLLNRAVTIAVGVLLTFGIYSAIAGFGQGRSTRRRATIAFAASLTAAFAQAGVLMVADGLMRRPQDEFRFQAREGFVVIQKGLQIRIERAATEPLVLTLPKIGELGRHDIFRVFADATVVWLFFFAAWSAFYLAVQAQAETLDARRRIAEAESAAQQAQVRALRYQVNPHFLFNTLNSLSSLVLADRSAEAESMILKLSAFFRSSLTLDPTADVTLADEIALQQHYLDIETVRFPKRLRVEIAVPPELERARLPALLLQPLVENAIKYGVAATREKVVLTIATAFLEPDRLLLTVTNRPDGKASGAVRTPPDGGTGVGLTNVCERLRARFGNRANCSFGPRKDGGYEVRMTMPFEPAPAPAPEASAAHG
ncbi:MAG: sensor histidine kinase [Sphingomicrobium sp.]